MAKSLLDQLTQVKGTQTFEDTMQNDYAEQCGRSYDSGTLATTSGSATMDGSGFSGNFEKDEVGNFIVIDSGDAAGVYEIASVVSTTQITVTPAAAGTDASAAARAHFQENLEDDLNYLRFQIDAVIGETNWFDDPASSISGLNSEITSVSGSLASDIASGDSSTLSSAQSYADSGDATTLSGAQSYADSGDSSTLSSANSYADGVGTAANGYTDTQLALQDTFIEMNDTPAGYDDTKLVLSTGAAIVYTSDLTWNDTTNALTITSGTFGFSDKGTTVNEISIDTTLAGASDDAVPTEAAVKSYVDTSISTGTDALDFYKTISDGTASFEADGNDDTLTFNGAGGIIVSAASGTQTVTISGAADFAGLTDTPASYIESNAGYMVRVNDAADGLDFASTIITDVSGNTTIYGDLSVSGTVFYVDHETVQVSDNMITVNYGEVGVGVTNIYGGIEVDRGTLENYWFVFDETDDWFKIGTSGTLQPVATRGAALTDTYIPFGDADSSYTESSDFSYNDTTKALDINGSIILANGTSVNELSTDTTLSGNSDDAVPTEKAVKTYVDTVAAAQDAFIELSDTPAAFVDNNLLVSTASGLEFTSAVTFNGSTLGVTGDMTASGAVGGDTLSVSSTAIDTNGNISAAGTMGFVAGTTINEFSIDTTFSGNSDNAVPTEAAIKAYVDTGDSATLSSAQSYADGGDSSTLSSAQSYADGVGTSANSYTDTQLALQDTFIEMTDTPAAYDDTKLVMSTGAAIEYTTDLTWNDSTNALTIASGTFGFSNVGTTVNNISTDTTMAGDSDDTIATEHAIKTYVDVATSSISGTVGSLTFLSLTDTPNTYIADRMLFTGASGVFFSAGVTWNETADAMAVAGTLGMGIGTTINEFSIDTTLAGNSDDALPTEKAVKAYADGIGTSANSYADGVGTSTLSSAQGYADSGDSSTLSSAQSYADGVGTAANSYADGVGTAANGYTDTQLALQDTFVEMNDTPAGYDDTKLVMSTGAAIVYTSDLTWNDTTNAMTITSGTLGFSSGTTVNEFSTDTTLSGNSDDAVPTEAAVKGYVDAEITGQLSYNVNLTKNGDVWEYNGGFTTTPDNVVIYLNGVRNKSNDADYYTTTVTSGVLQIDFAYDTYSDDWVTATYGSVQGGIYVKRWEVKIADYQATSADRIMVDTSATGSNGTPFTVTLPASPNVGDVVYVFDAGGACATTNVTIGRNGSNIMGVASDMDVDVDEASVELVYYNASLGWRLV